MKWMTELGVKQSDAEQYSNNLFAESLTTISRLKKYVVKKGASVLEDELGFKEIDADEIKEALMIEEKDNGNSTGNDSGKVVAIDPKLVRSNEDIRPAVNLWCSDRAAAERKYGHISQWDTSAVTDMKELFKDMKDFNDDISQWNVGNVTNMNSMFYYASAFNQPIGQWNVGYVTNMRSMSFMPLPSTSL